MTSISSFIKSGEIPANPRDRAALLNECRDQILTLQNSTPQNTMQLPSHKGPRLIHVTNKLGRLKLGDVSKATIEKLLEEISRAFGATAAKNGMDFGTLTAHAENGVDVLEIEIHSPGGSVFDGLKFYHELIALRSRGVKVKAHINSLAASMGSVIAMAADEVSAVPHAKFMLHDVSSSSGGTAADHARSAKLCDQLSNDLATIYARRSKRPLAEVRKLMLAETWLSAPEAVAAKFVDRIIGAPTATASKPGSTTSKLDTYNSLTGHEKRDFLSKHSFEIRELAKASKP